MRITFSLDDHSVLAGRLSPYNKHERSVVIKQALLEYFGLPGGIGKRQLVAAEKAQESVTPAPVAMDVLGDFG